MMLFMQIFSFDFHIYANIYIHIRDALDIINLSTILVYPVVFDIT